MQSCESCRNIDPQRALGEYTVEALLTGSPPRQITQERFDLVALGSASVGNRCGSASRRRDRRLEKPV